MFGYKMIQTVRSNGAKLDRPLKDEILQLYEPFKSMPCFLHNLTEKYISKWKQMSVIIEFGQDHYQTGYDEVCRLINGKRRCGVRKEFSIVSCCSADVTPGIMAEMLETCNHIKKVYLNRKVTALLDTAVTAANARRINRNDKELTGKGTTVAVVDTGIYPHTDLAGRIIGFVDFIGEKSDPCDDNGHGTHCAGCVAGNGSASLGQYKGPAPEANLIGVKVLDKAGSGTLETVMQGIQWCIDYNKEEGNFIDIISMSLGSAAQRHESEKDDPMVKMVDKAWDSGIVVVAAAGNEGPEEQTIASPGISGTIITVGALDDQETELRDDDEAADFSSRGPTIYGKSKPDILAPGVNITSLRSPNSFIDKTQKANREGEDYFILSGTSMAAPICAGVIALLLEYDPQLTPNRIKNALKEGTDLWIDRDPNIYGAGYINAKNTISSI
ncbi:S8 family peptidase [Alteribacillus sp. JSM 102045]|uniref:S8 family peptidase n=1 Tax=Alteribacillus sp. JSM 102045 TaxID=1562101 RepID=UPI0035C1703E